MGSACARAGEGASGSEFRFAVGGGLKKLNKAEKAEKKASVFKIALIVAVAYIMIIAIYAIWVTPAGAGPR
jgi:hypothetical protein